MTKLLQTLADGTAVGALYALIALGYTLVYGILQFINFAHSDVFALGAWVSFTVAMAATIFVSTLATASPPPFWFGLAVLLVAMLFCGGVGLIIERFAYRPLRNAPRLNVLITAIGVSLLLQNIGQLEYLRVQQEKVTTAVSVEARFPGLGTLASVSGAANEQAISATWTTRPRAPNRAAGVGFSSPLMVLQGPEVSTEREREFSLPFGPYPKGMPPLIQDRVISSSIIEIHFVDVVILGTAIILMLAIEWLIYRTKMGLAMRAVAFNHRTAALMGINVDRVISFTFGLGAALAAAAGFLFVLSPKYSQLKQTADTTWVLLGLKAFVAAVVGGIGNVRGAMLGGLCIGLFEFLGVAYVSDKYRDVYVFSVLIIVLLVRPSGILGKTTREKV